MKKENGMLFSCQRDTSIRTQCQMQESESILQVVLIAPQFL